VTTEELSELTRGWQGLPWETRDLFARWLAGVLTDQGIDKPRRLAVQEALLSLDGDAPADVLPRRLRTARRDTGMSQAARGAAVGPAEGVLP
jgi:hypothetical protein